MDRHCYADPDPTSHLDAIRSLSQTHVENKKNFTFIHSIVSLHCLIFLVRVIGVIFFNFGQFIEIF
jgi:hypothetical protein